MLREEISQLLREHLRVEEVPLNIPPNRKMGDISSAICLSLAKQLRRPPMEIARETVARIGGKLPRFIKEAGVTAPGYINFKIDWQGVSREIIPEIIDKGNSFGKPSSERKEKVFIEHTSVNPNKAMHIGHLRNAVLGDTVARVLEWVGYTTEVCNYIDDTGMQVVDVVTAFLFLDPPFYSGQDTPDLEAFWAKCPADEPFDYFCWDLYTRFQKEMEANPSLQEKRGEVLHSIEKGNNPIAIFAKELAMRIVRAHLDTVSSLNVFYDLLNWESDIIRFGFWQATFELLKEKGVISFETSGPNAGCWVVPLGGLVKTEEGIKSLDKILVRSDGTVTYTGKDVAYQLWKFGLLERDFLYRVWGKQPNGKYLWTTSETGKRGDELSRRFGHADWVVNVIDVRQSYPQHVVAQCLRQMGFEKQADRSIHLAYEVVNLSPKAAALLSDGSGNECLDSDEMSEKRSIAMSGRSGIGVKARDLIEMVKQQIIKKTDHPIDDDTASALAASAIRYYLTKFTLESQIIFDFEEALKTTGDTGIYLEYAHARACSIMKKAADRGIDFVWREDCVPSELTDTERNLVDALTRFPEAVARASKSFRISQLAEYAFDLASAFTDFYEHADPESSAQVPFIHLANEKIRTFRLSLVKAFRIVMANVLSILGMPALERI